MGTVRPKLVRVSNEIEPLEHCAQEQPRKVCDKREAEAFADSWKCFHHGQDSSHSSAKTPSFLACTIVHTFALAVQSAPA